MWLLIRKCLISFTYPLDIHKPLWLLSVHLAQYANPHCGLHRYLVHRNISVRNLNSRISLYIFSPTSSTRERCSLWQSSPEIPLRRGIYGGSREPPIPTMDVTEESPCGHLPQGLKVLGNEERVVSRHGFSARSTPAPRGGDMCPSIRDEVTLYNPIKFIW